MSSNNHILNLHILNIFNLHMQRRPIRLLADLQPATSRTPTLLAWEWNALTNELKAPAPNSAARSVLKARGVRTYHVLLPASPGQLASVTQILYSKRLIYTPGPAVMHGSRGPITHVLLCMRTTSVYTAHFSAFASISFSWGWLTVLRSPPQAPPPTH